MEINQKMVTQLHTVCSPQTPFLMISQKESKNVENLSPVLETKAGIHTSEIVSAGGKKKKIVSAGC